MVYPRPHAERQTLVRPHDQQSTAISRLSRPSVGDRLLDQLATDSYHHAIGVAHLIGNHARYFCPLNGPEPKTFPVWPLATKP